MRAHEFIIEASPRTTSDELINRVKQAYDNRGPKDTTGDLAAKLGITLIKFNNILDRYYQNRDKIRDLDLERAALIRLYWDDPEYHDKSVFNYDDIKNLASELDIDPRVVRGTIRYYDPVWFKKFQEEVARRRLVSGTQNNYKINTEVAEKIIQGYLEGLSARQAIRNFTLPIEKASYSKFLRDWQAGLSPEELKVAIDTRQESQDRIKRGLEPRDLALTIRHLSKPHSKGIHATNRTGPPTGGAL